MTRLGLCCAFVEEPIRFRTTTATYLLKLPNPLDHLDKIILANILSLEQAIRYCAKAHIGSFRINSEFFPAVTHKKLKYTLTALPSADLLEKKLKECGDLAKKQGIRLVFHPNQFVNLGSPREEVIESSIADLEYHGELADYLGADVVNIHGGGAYGDKTAALTRFVDNFKKMSKKAQKYVTIENDDKTYTPSDLLPVCKELGIPLVYDVHHHRCLADNLSIEEATAAAIETWDREPLFHVSSPLEGWQGPQPFRHHDYIDFSDIPDCWRTINPLTIEIEAKAKELAIRALYSKLTESGWNIKQ